MYLSYEEYIEYGGTLDEPTFNSCEFRAEKIIDGMTANRVRKMEVIPEAVKRCVQELIYQEQLYDVTLKQYNARASKGETVAPVASFSTDGYSETYSGGSQSTGSYFADFRNGLDVLSRRIVADYLAYEYDDNNVKLLYKGVY